MIAIGIDTTIGRIARPIDAEATQSSDFASFFQNALDGAMATTRDAHAAATQALLGKADVPEAMIKMEQAQLALELTVQIRNKVVQAYDELSKLQF